MVRKRLRARMIERVREGWNKRGGYKDKERERMRVGPIKIEIQRQRERELGRETHSD